MFCKGSLDVWVFYGGLMETWKPLYDVKGPFHAHSMHRTQGKSRSTPFVCDIDDWRSTRLESHAACMYWNQETAHVYASLPGVTKKMPYLWWKNTWGKVKNMCGLSFIFPRISGGAWPQKFLSRNFGIFLDKPRKKTCLDSPTAYPLTARRFAPRRCRELLRTVPMEEGSQVCCWRLLLLIAESVMWCL